MLPLAAASAADPNGWMILPFAALLLAIALFPLIHRHHWERSYHWIAAGLGAITAGYYLFALGAWERLLHVAHEYVSFMALIGSLYVVAGGIHLTVSGRATPARNGLFLLAGGALANVFGTTGASMVLIRPWLRMNRERAGARHVVFFIFIVSNAGGLLTPIGDPPLFLGYLKGVPFWWTAARCWPAWLLGMTWLLAVFFFLDRRAAPALSASDEVPWRVRGALNFVFLAAILGAVLFLKNPPLLREAVMLAAAAGSYFTTPRDLHAANRFSFLPLKEVVWLFAGIFATMTPALDFLETHAAALGLESPQQLYWLTGALSAVLDNAPTYLAFLAAAFGSAGLSLENPAHLPLFLATHGGELAAISIAAVFFGAATYIGNGPNLLVKAIAEEAQVRMPSFFGYVLRYALPILLPLFCLVAWLFFSRGRVW